MHSRIRTLLSPAASSHTRRAHAAISGSSLSERGSAGLLRAVPAAASEDRGWHGRRCSHTAIMQTSVLQWFSCGGPWGKTRRLRSRHTQETFLHLARAVIVYTPGDPCLWVTLWNRYGLQYDALAVAKRDLSKLDQQLHVRDVLFQPTIAPTHTSRPSRSICRDPGSTVRRHDSRRNCGDCAWSRSGMRRTRRASHGPTRAVAAVSTGSSGS